MKEYLYKEIGERLRGVAIKKFGSVAELERILRKSKSYLSQYITGRNKPGKWLLGELKELRCDVEYIMTGKPSVVYFTDHDTQSDIYSRLHEFAQKYYGDLSSLLDKMNIGFENIDDLFYFEDDPPYGLLRKLIEAGCDINWLLNGVRSQNLLLVEKKFHERLNKLEEDIGKIKETNLNLLQENLSLKGKNEELEKENNTLHTNLDKNSNFTKAERNHN